MTNENKPPISSHPATSEDACAVTPGSLIINTGGADGARKTPEDPADAQVHKHYAGQNPSLAAYGVKIGKKMSQASRKANTKRNGDRHHEDDVADSTKVLRSVSVHPILRPLRHTTHVMLLLAGWLLGTVIFYYTEAPAEHQMVADTYAQLNDAFDIIADDMISVTASTNNDTVVAEHKAYIRLLEIEGKWRWSAIQKTEGPEAHYMWTFGTSFFFVFTVFTTVGYGSIYPWTDAGRAITILFGCVLYPFSIVVVRDLGQLMLVGLTRVYGKVLIKIREAQGYITKESEVISLPWVMALIVSMGFIALSAVFFKYYDEAIAPYEEFTYFISFYFSFLSFTMIGLGDIMPTNEPWAPIVAVIIWLGLPLMRVITKMTYLRMENFYFGAFVYIESRLGAKKQVEPEAPKAVENTDNSDSDEDEDEEAREKRIRDKVMLNFTVRSLGKCIASGRDVYGGEFGRVDLKKSDL